MDCTYDSQVGIGQLRIYEFFMRALSRSYTPRRSLSMPATIWIEPRPEEMEKMTTVTAINKIGGSLANRNTAVRQSRRRWTAGLFVSAVLGAVSGLVGLTIGFLTLVELFVPSTILYTSGTVLIGASFILFGLAAHCLDKVAEADKAIRLEYCRQHGLRDEECETKENTK